MERFTDGVHPEEKDGEDEEAEQTARDSDLGIREEAGGGGGERVAEMRASWGGKEGERREDHEREQETECERQRKREKERPEEPYRGA